MKNLFLSSPVESFVTYFFSPRKKCIQRIKKARGVSGGVNKVLFKWKERRRNGKFSFLSPPSFQTLFSRAPSSKIGLLQI